MRSLSANKLDQVAQDPEAQQVMDNLRSNPNRMDLVEIYVDRDKIEGKDLENSKGAVNE